MLQQFLESLVVLISLQPGTTLLGPRQYQSPTEGGTLDIRFDSMNWKGGRDSLFQLQNFAIRFDMPEWIIAKNSFVSIACKDIKAHWELPGAYDLPSPKSVGWESWRTSTEAKLKTWFDREMLRRHLKITGNCPSGSFEALREIVFVRLEKYPEKNPADWEGLSLKIYTELQKAVEQQLPASLQKYPWKFQIDQGVLVLTLNPKFPESFPAPKEDYLSFSSSGKSQVRLLWDPKIFSRQLAPLLTDSETQMQTALSREEWELLWPELATSGVLSEQLKFYTSFVKEEGSFQVQPFVQNAFERGIQVKFQLQLRADNYKKRIPLKIKYLIKRQNGQSRLNFSELRWDEEALIPEDFNFRGEAQVTLDWIFKNMDLQNLIGVELKSALPLGMGVFSVFGSNDAFSWTQDIKDFTPIN